MENLGYREQGIQHREEKGRIPLLTEEIVTEQLCDWSKEQQVQNESEQQETLGQMSYGGEERRWN